MRRVLLVLAVGAAPGWAGAWTLDALLRLPLEHLLRLDAAPQRVSCNARTPGVRHPAGEGKRHVA